MNLKFGFGALKFLRLIVLLVHNKRGALGELIGLADSSRE